MKTAIITTVGTSLKNNYVNNYPTGEVSVRAYIDFIKNFGETKASAELNSLSYLVKSEEDKVYFLYSDTENSKFCADVLQHYLKNIKGLSVELVKIPHLQYKEITFKERGLKSFVRVFSELIIDLKKLGLNVKINATGGFKAESAYATLIGQLFKVPVYYIHEVFKDIIELPPIPISIDIKYWEIYEPDLEWLFEKPRGKKEVEKRQLPDEVEFLLIEEDGKMALGPHGVAFFEAYLDKVETVKRIEDKREKTVRTQLKESSLWGKGINSISNIPNKEARLMLKKILSYDFVESIHLTDYHDVGKSKTPFLKLTSKKTDFQVIYELNCSDGQQNIGINVKKGFIEKLIYELGKEFYPYIG